MVPEFHWVIRERLAGSGQPGLFNSLEVDVEALKRLGIRMVVVLTEFPPEPALGVEPLRVVHFPIPDMGIPTPRDAAAVCLDVTAALSRDEPVLLHCRAGKGRTGTMLACCLVSLGHSPAQALTQVRTVFRGYVESAAQEAFIGHFADYIESRDNEAPTTLPGA